MNLLIASVPFIGTAYFFRPSDKCSTRAWCVAICTIIVIMLLLAVVPVKGN